MVRKAGDEFFEFEDSESKDKGKEAKISNEKHHRKFVSMDYRQFDNEKIIE
jgi:hypothetical protein